MSIRFYGHLDQCPGLVVRRFFGDEDVVDVAFPLARLAHADEFRSPAQFHETRGPHVAHSGLHSANQLLDIRSKRSAMRYTALDSFGHERALGNSLLAAAIAHPFAHRAQRAHPAVELVRASLVESRLAGTLLGSREQ